MAAELPLRSDFGEKPVDESRCGTCPFSDAFCAHFTKVLGSMVGNWAMLAPENTRKWVTFIDQRR
ncbi:MAG: hypothetical protein EBU12_08215 [Microbacteriaceae bacterium]|nr:hypothetical protein [Microbacteriaceae bacterium]